MKGTYYDPGKMESRAVEIIDNIPFNATEIAACWNTYMQYTLFVCIFKYFSQTAEDNEIRPIIEDVVDICAKRVKWVTELFKREGIPIPFGFSDNDVDITVPRLFTDPLCFDELLNITLDPLRFILISIFL